MSEIWKKIPFASSYMVSNAGRVQHNGREIKPWCDTHGYLQFDVRVNGVRRTLLLHRIVASLFIPNPNGYKEVNHKDEDKTNCGADNLEWCTRQYNVIYNGFNGHVRPVQQIDKHGKLVAEYEYPEEASRITGINANYIRRVCRGDYGRKTAGGYIWRYKDEDKEDDSMSFTIHCPHCGGTDYNEEGVYDYENLGDDRVIFTFENTCNDCGRTFYTVRDMLCNKVEYEDEDGDSIDSPHEIKEGEENDGIICPVCHGEVVYDDMGVLPDWMDNEHGTQAYKVHCMNCGAEYKMHEAIQVTAREFEELT